MKVTILLIAFVFLTFMASAMTSAYIAISFSEARHKRETVEEVQRAIRETKNLLNDCELNGSQFVESNEMQMYARNSK